MEKESRRRPLHKWGDSLCVLRRCVLIAWDVCVCVEFFLGCVCLLRLNVTVRVDDDDYGPCEACVWVLGSALMCALSRLTLEPK